MRKLALLLFLMGFVPWALAADRVTVAQADQLLAASHGKRDGRVAGEISGLELTERASSATLSHWEAEFPGRHSRQALIALADASAFLNLPAAEIPAIPPPDVKTQLQILSRAIDYVAKTIPKLPDFFATRNTTHFADAPLEESLVAQYGGSIRRQASRSAGQTSQQFQYQPLHAVGVSSVIVTYSDSREVDEQKGKGGKLRSSALSLTTKGEFGPILGLVLADAVQGYIVWSHWEHGSAVPEAVFQYKVPEGKSHYMVQFPAKMGPVQQYPAYHGEIAIDPASGSILRLTVVSDVKPPNERVSADIAVEYGPVAIGGATYICPVKSVALSRVPILNDPGRFQTQLNDGSFTQYHLFRAQSQMLPVESAKSEANPPPAASAAGNAPAPPPVSGSPTSGPPASGPGSGLPSAAQKTVAQNQIVPSAAASPTPTSTPASTPGAPNPAPAQPAVAATEQVHIPPASLPKPAAAVAESAPAVSPASGIPHANSPLTLLDVVVTDHGKAVRGLDRSRFHLFENGREQTIVSFVEHGRAAPAASVPAAQPPSASSNVPHPPEPGAANVLLLDTLNTPPQDQANVRSQISAYLGKTHPGAPMAIFLLSSRLQMVRGFTAGGLQPGKMAQSVEAALRQPAVPGAGGSGNNPADGGAAPVPNSSGPDGMAAKLALPAAGSETAQNGVATQGTLEALQQLALYLNGVPGRKNLIWFSGSFPVALGPGDPHRKDADEVRKTSELLSAARVAIYPVGARGQMAQPSSGAFSAAQAGVGQGPPVFMEQTADEQASMNKLAKQTGGQAYLNTDGLQEAVDKAVENGSSYYTIGYAPSDKKLDGKVRKIRLRIDKAHYALAYRPESYALNQPSDH